ncbi:MAG: GNAT family N-acetyltransferase [Candidatus Omnitrophica bacterium]|nr:GNAT family N-acetyltransferase [Candidatus Omnitrophota bacterium]
MTTVSPRNEAARITVRKFLPKDRDALRRICCDTAHFGEPCEVFFPDRELLADLVMKYFTDYDSRYTWVAEEQGTPVGYVCACVDDRAYSRTMLLRILPVSLAKMLARGKIFSAKTGRMIKYNVLSAFQGDARLRPCAAREYPVHIHQNIMDGYRGRGIGRKLLIPLLEEAARRRWGIRFRALRQVPRFAFFERFGFRRLDVTRVKTWEAWLHRAPLYYMEYGKRYE